MSSTDSSAEKRITGTSERREQIIQRLRAQGSVQVNDLSLLYGVSTVTIRNDLAFLEKQGIAVRAYGGALICEGNAPGVEPSVEDKSSLNTAVKRSIAQAAAELVKPGHRIILDSGTFYGDQAEQSLQNYHFDLLFLGVDAIDLDRGVSTHNEDEARLNRKMCEVAERIIVVTDSSKFNRSSLHKIIDTQRIDMIIVDEGIPAESLEGLRKSGIDVVLV